MRYVWMTVCIAAGLATGSVQLRAHPPTTLSSASELGIAEEISAFRKSMAEAIRDKAVVRLKEMYHSSFSHTHTSGKTDNRDARIVSALSGEPMIETAELLEFTVRVPNDWTAIVLASSPIKSLADGKVYAVKWMQVYSRTEKSWALVASQATRSHEIKP